MEGKMAPSQYEIAYYKAGFAEAIWIIEGVLKNKLHKDSQVDRIARRTVEAIVTTLRKTALKEINSKDVTKGLGVSYRRNYVILGIPKDILSILWSMMMRDRSHVWKSRKTLRDHASPDWVCSAGAGRRPPQADRARRPCCVL
jgi:hypothetical protein